MKSTKYILLITLSFLFTWESTAQSEEVLSYSLKKGQVFDIIFLSTKDSTEALQKKYFSTAFPVAGKAGYNPLKGFGIKQKPLQGNYHPSAMIFGAWPSIEVREKFLVDIVKEVPDFHSMRKEIWSNFDLTYWEIQEDISFDVDRSKFNVVTSFWKKEGASIKSYKNEWLKKSAKEGATKLIQLENGTSPFGYHYNPDFLVMTTWEDKESYDAFMKKVSELDQSAIKLIHELTF